MTQTDNIPPSSPASSSPDSPPVDPVAGATAAPAPPGRGWWHTSVIARHPRLRVALPQLLFTLLLLATAAAFLATLVIDVVWGRVLLGMGLLILLAVTAETVRWERYDPRWVSVLPALDLLATGALRAGLLPEGISFSLFCFVPVVWLVLLLQRTGVLLSVLIIVCTISVPSLFLIHPYFTTGGIVRNSVLPVSGALIGWLAFLLYQQLQENLARLLTAQRQLQELNRVSEQRARLLASVGESLNVGVLVMDAHGNDVLYNHAQQQLHGLVSPPENADRTEAGHHIYRADGHTPIPPTERPAYRATHGELFENMHVVAGEPGSPQQVYSVSSRHTFDDAGRWELTVLVFSDITELQAAIDERNVFVATVSHELRTPLTSIVGYADLAADEDEAQEEPLAEYLGVISRNAAQLLALVEDLLLQQRLRIGRTERDLERTDLSELARAAVSSHRPQATAAGHTLLTRLAPDVPALDLEASRIAQVLGNLLTNAVKYTPAGGTIVVSTETTPESAGFTVADNGAGMDPQEAEKMFSPFYRSSSAVHSAIPGTGLGLSLCRSIVEAHGGRITMRTAPGQGTAVSVRLPLPRPEEAA